MNVLIRWLMYNIEVIMGITGAVGIGIGLYLVLSLF